MRLLTHKSQYPELLKQIASLDNPVPALRDLCKGDLFFLLRYALKRKDVESDWLFNRCRDVQLAPDNYLDLWAREHYKSTIITFALTIQEILNNPNVTIGIFSHTRPIAKGFLRQIKREFELNDDLKAWFSDILYENPSKEAIKWSEDDGIIVKRSSNPKEGTIEAWGVVDGQPTSKHYSLLIYDDIVTRESVNTPEMIEKTTDALALSYNLGAHGGKRRFIGTRYHFNDTYKTIIDRGTATPRIHSATHDGTPTGEAVFLTNEQLADKRRDMGPYVFATQMLQNPIADSSQGFQREWLRYYKKIDVNKLVWYLLIDAANGKRKTNDYTSIWAVGLSSDRNMYAIPEVRDRINLTERAKRIIELHRKYRPIQVRYEQYGMQGDIAYIQLIQEEEDYRFNIIEVSGSTNKLDRIKRLVPTFENSNLWFPEKHMVTDTEGKTRNLVHDFIEEEFVPFPVPIHDDMLDSLSRIHDTEGEMNGKGGKIQIKLSWPKEKQTEEEPDMILTAGSWMG